MTQPPHDPVGFRLLNEIGIIAQLSSAHFEALLPDGLSMAGFSVLNHFVRLGDERMLVDLARAFQVSKGAMTNTVQRLEARGLVEVRPDATDRRAKRVHITAAGRAMREDCVARLAPTLAALDAGFDRDALSGLLPPLAGLRAWFDGRR